MSAGSIRGIRVSSPNPLPLHYIASTSQREFKIGSHRQIERLRETEQHRGRVRESMYACL